MVLFLTLISIYSVDFKKLWYGRRFILPLKMCFTLVTLAAYISVENACRDLMFL